MKLSNLHVWSGSFPAGSPASSCAGWELHPNPALTNSPVALAAGHWGLHNINGHGTRMHQNQTLTMGFNVLALTVSRHLWCNIEALSAL